MFDEIAIEDPGPACGWLSEFLFSPEATRVLTDGAIGAPAAIVECRGFCDGWSDLSPCPCSQAAPGAAGCLALQGVLEPALLILVPPRKTRPRARRRRSRSIRNRASESSSDGPSGPSPHSPAYPCVPPLAGARFCTPGNRA